MVDPFSSYFDLNRLDGDSWERRGIFEVNRKTGQRRLAPSFSGGQPALGKVPTPDTSAGAIAREGLKTVGTAWMRNLVTAPEQAESVLAAPGAAIRGVVTGKPDLGPLATRQGDLGRLTGLTTGMHQRQTERLAEASQDLPAPISSALYSAAELGAGVLDPTNIPLGSAASRVPRAARLSDLGEEMATLGRLGTEEGVATAARGLAEAVPDQSAFLLRDGSIVPTGPFHDLNVLPEGIGIDDIETSGFIEGGQYIPREQMVPGVGDLHSNVNIRNRMLRQSGMPESGELPAGQLAQVNAAGAQARGAEAGFARNPWAPESDLYKQTYGIRHDFVTEQNVAVRQSAVRSQALQKAIPDKAVREDMTALFHGTGNPLVKGDHGKDAAARLAASPYAAEAQQAIDAWRKRSDKLFELAREAGAEDLGYFKNYLHMVYKPPVGERAIRGSRLAEGAVGSVQKARAFKNPAEAIRAGWQPRSLDFSVLMHETERAHAHTRAILSLMDDIAEVPEGAIVRAAVNPDPKQYVKPVGFPILDRGAGKRALPPAQTAQASLPGLEDLGRRSAAEAVEGGNVYVHKDLWRNLSPVLKSDDAVALDKALSVVKRVKFLGSLFHGMTLTHSAINTMGPIRGTIEAGKRGFGLPGVSQIAARLGGGKLSEEAVEEAIRAGVNVEPPRLDVMQGTFEDMLRRTETSLAKPGASVFHPRNALGKVMAGTRHVAEFYDEALWANYHAPLKVTAYHVLKEKLARSPSKAVAKMSEEEISRKIGEFVNDAFGGQNWQLLHQDFLADPLAQRWMRRLFLSPDWNVSAIKTGLSTISSDPVRRQLGRRYLVNATSLIVGYNMLNKALTGHYMWGNQDGHEWDLDTGMHDSDGKRIYYAVSKHERETPEFFIGRETATGRELPVGDFLARKMNPPLSGAVTALTGKTPSGFPGALDRAREQADKEGRELTNMQDLGARGRDLAGGLLPFVGAEAMKFDERTHSFKADPGTVARRLLVPFSESHGLNLRDAGVLYAEAWRAGDRDRLAEIDAWLEDNGYDRKQVRATRLRARRAALKFPDEDDSEVEGPAVPPSGNDPFDQYFNLQ